MTGRTAATVVLVAVATATLTAGTAANGGDGGTLAPCAVIPDPTCTAQLSNAPLKPDLLARITIADAGQNNTKSGCSVAVPESESDPDATVKPNTNAHDRADATRDGLVAISVPAGADRVVERVPARVALLSTPRWPQRSGSSTHDRVATQVPAWVGS